MVIKEKVLLLHIEIKQVINHLKFRVMTNKEICKAFAQGATEGKANSMHIYENRIFSYDTCIAQRHGKKILFNVTKYSPTTSKQQTYLRHAISQEGLEVVEVSKVKPYTRDLSKVKE